MVAASSVSRFVGLERATQAAWFARAGVSDSLLEGSTYRLKAEEKSFNLEPSIRSSAKAYFDLYGITWHRHANHGLSSQVCCLNFLMPLATRPDVLSRLIGGALDITPPEMLMVEPGPNGEPWFVGFEWTGRRDYLGEWPARGRVTRGANATSADAIVRFQSEGRIETLLIEWKYSEHYGACIPPSGNGKRIARYADKTFAPNGPIRSDLGLKVEDFFWEPFYQLLRQQMLAFQIQAAREDGAERVRVLHISPADNRALHAVTAPSLARLGQDAFDVFSAVLVDRKAFMGRTIEEVFGPLVAEMPGDPWAAYLLGRYAFMASATPAGMS